MARPKKPDEARRTEYLQLRMTKNERAALERGAKSYKQALSDFIRRAALEKAHAVTMPVDPKTGH